MQKKFSHNWLGILRRGLTDLWFVLAMLIALFLLLVLFGYHATDPGWSTSGITGEVQHWLGPIGAYIADTLMSLFGYAVYLFPIGLITIGWLSAKREYSSGELMIWKCIGLFASVLALSGIFAFHWTTEINSLAVTGGGLLGQKLSTVLLDMWPVVWIMGLYTLILFAGLTLIFEVNWLNVIAAVGYLPAMLVYRFTELSEPLSMMGEAERQGNITNSKERRSELLKRLKSKTPAQEVLSTFSESRLEPVQDVKETEPVLPENKIVEEASTQQTSSVLNWSDYKREPVLNIGDVADEPEDDSALLEEATFKEEIVDRNIYTQKENLFSAYDAFASISLTEAPATEVPTTEVPTTEVPTTEVPTTEVPIAEMPTTEMVEDPFSAIEGDDDAEMDFSFENDTKTASIDPASIRVRLDSGNIQNRFQASSLEEDKPYHLPSLSLLKVSPPKQTPSSEEQFERLAPLVEQALKNYRLEVRVVGVEVGPVVTRLELDLAPGIKVSQISNLDKDLARSLSVPSLRVVDVIPGKPYIGLEIPNQKREIVHLREILESKNYQEAKSPLTMVLGADIAGKPKVANLAKMPHLLVAGTTGSGKSVAINVMLASMLYKARPEDLKLILIDPKMLEMSMYEDIPHLLTPVVTDMEEAENSLRWAVAEMERRYQLMAAFKVRNLSGFNQTIRKMQSNGERIDDPLWNPEDHLGLANQPPQIEPLPYIVIVIDELADMMMAVGKKVEELIARIAQKARAAGIHLVLATQRPSVDVITGLIKANVPTRLAFQVSSKIDSRTIIDGQGAETLLGYGDGLFVPPGSSAPQRVHGAFIEDSEVDALTTYLKSQAEPEYEESITNPVPASAMGALGAQEKSDDPEQDPLYDEACQMVIESGKASISWLQRRLQIGYNRSARIIEAMEVAGIVSPADRGARKVLVSNNNHSDDF